MRLRSLLAGIVAAGTLAACAGGTSAVPNQSSPFAVKAAAPDKAAANAIKNGCFDTGTTPWKIVKGAGSDSSNPPSGSASIVKGGYGTCKHSAFAGTTKAPAPNGFWGVSQTVKMTKAGKLSWWYWGSSTEDIKYGDQEVDVVVGGKIVDACFSADTTNSKKAWKLGTCTLSKYAGKTVTLQFGVYDNGYSKTYVSWYVSDITLQ
jgi:hypothetical protein